MMTTHWLTQKAPAFGRGCENGSGLEKPPLLKFRNSSASVRRARVCGGDSGSHDSRIRDSISMLVRFDIRPDQAGLDDL
jgi:hypothetical protein